MRNNVRVERYALALTKAEPESEDEEVSFHDLAKAAATEAASEIAEYLKADYAYYRNHVLSEVWKRLRDAYDEPLYDAMAIIKDMMEGDQQNVDD